jgi:hypothetical protein
MRDIPGYEKIYAVDRQGNVWRIGAPRGRPLKPVLVEGYCRVVLSKGGVKKRFFVHQLMLRTYVGPKPEGTEPRHRNGVRTDNRLRNLAYGTHQENIDDRKRHGNWKQFGETAYQAKLTNEQVREIKQLASLSGVELSRLFNVSQAIISHIRSGKNWKSIT